MDLTIQDVAELLNVSTATIDRWISEGKIPVYQLNNQHRFNRGEIENWVLNNPLESDEKTKDSGTKQFSLYRALHRGGLFYDVPGTTKEEVIRHTMKQLAEKLSLDAEVLTDLLMDREEMMSTGIGHGIAVPHTRDFLLNTGHDVLAIAFSKEPIAYGALDGEPVHTLFFLFACEDKRHLHLLAKIAHLAGKPVVQELHKNPPEKTDLLNKIKIWESSIQSSSPYAQA